MANNRASRIESVRKRIVPVREHSQWVNVLVYGRNGHGKTRFAASGPNTLVADINEEGTRSIGTPDAEVFEVKRWEDLTYLYWYLREGNHEHDTVVLDTLTQAQQMCMSHVLKRAEDRDPNRPPSMPDRRSWGQLGELMKPLLLDFRNLPMNVVFVCQNRKDITEEDDSDEVVTRWVPNLSPSVRDTAESSVGIMGYIYQKEVTVVPKGKDKKKKTEKRWVSAMLVGPHELYDTKDRTNQLGRIIINPTMPKFIEAWKNRPQEEE
jgi:hypothetical protein